MFATQVYAKSSKNIIGKFTYVSDEKSTFVLNAQSDSRVTIHLSDTSKLKGFKDLYLDLDIDINSKCMSVCDGKLIKLNSIYPAYKTVPTYHSIGKL